MTEENNAVLTLMCGLPRSGKSTWINENKGDNVIVSPDEIRRTVFGHQFHPNAEGFVWALAGSMAQLLLEQEKDVIIDATNLTSERRLPWLIMARKYDLELRIIWMKTSLEECLKRNEASPEGKKVPDTVLEMMNVSLEAPRPHRALAGDKHCIEVVEVT